MPAAGTLTAVRPPPCSPARETVSLWD
jgi:hypothetical protein